MVVLIFWLRFSGYSDMVRSSRVMMMLWTSYQPGTEIGLQGIGGATHLADLRLEDDYPFFSILHLHGSVLVGPDLDLLFDACPEIGDYTA